MHHLEIRALRSTADAARAFNMFKWEAKTAVRRIAAALYNRAPDTFDMPIQEAIMTYYGFGR